MDKHQIKNDLHWLTTSPVLMGSQANPAFLDRPFPYYNEKQLQSLLGKTTLLTRFIGSRQSQRLGIYYERLWQLWLTCQPDVDIISANLQVINGSMTLGEFDIIYKNARGALTHREMAVKFYLGLPCKSETSPASCWIGPNINDQLDKKLSKFARQIQLAHTPKGKQTLLQQGISLSAISGLNTEIVLQGYFFYPWNQSCPSPEGANPSHLRGHWVAVDYLSSFLEKADSERFLVLSKQQWLSPIKADMSQISLLSEKILRQTLQYYFTIKKRPILISAGNLFGQEYKEIRRFFVVPAHWLSQARDVCARSK